MARWAIGDIQGCMASLEALLAAIQFDPVRDRLWLVGDLVNRGPRSLDVLRWAHGLGEVVTTVLGNHDLHLLGRAAGVSKAKRRDTLEEVLAAPDRDALVDWLRTRPLCHAEDGFVLIHAGLHPRWSVADAVALAAELQALLAGPGWRAALEALAPGRDRAPAWRDDLVGIDRQRSALAWFTRVRMCRPDGTADTDFDGAPDDAPPGLVPWFALPERQWLPQVPVFGHWAALGLDVADDHIALDSACVWGERLTAIRLDDRAVVQVDAVEPPQDE